MDVVLSTSITPCGKSTDEAVLIPRLVSDYLLRKARSKTEREEAIQSDEGQDPGSIIKRMTRGHQALL